MNIPDLTSFTDANLLSLVAGFLLPPVIAIIQQPQWKNWLRALVTASICILCGFVQAYGEHKFGSDDILHNILVILIASNSFYRGFWKPLGSKTIEEATKLPDLSAIAAEKQQRADEAKLIADQQEIERKATLARARERLSQQDDERNTNPIPTQGDQAE